MKYSELGEYSESISTSAGANAEPVVCDWLLRDSVRNAVDRLVAEVSNPKLSSTARDAARDVLLERLDEPYVVCRLLHELGRLFVGHDIKQLRAAALMVANQLLDLNEWMREYPEAVAQFASFGPANDSEEVPPPYLVMVDLDPIAATRLVLALRAVGARRGTERGS